ncbi:hypothetical protein [Bradyrhizobium sp. USDA 10063]
MKAHRRAQSTHRHGRRRATRSYAGNDPPALVVSLNLKRRAI